MSEPASPDKGEAPSYQGYCCPMKHYYSQPKNLVDTLQITPRVLIYKKKLKTTESYLQTLKIKNIGLFPRRLRYFTDSPLDTHFFVDKNMVGRDLAPDITLIISIKIEPIDKKSIHRLRHIYLEVEHPNCIIEVPIIVLHHSGVSWPKSIEFPRGARRTKSYYELILYNPTNELVTVKLLCAKLLISQSARQILPKDYMRVLLMYDIRDMRPFSGEINIKVGKTPFENLHFKITPKPDSLFIGMSHMDFNAIKYNRISEKEFTVCNESLEAINFNMKFLTDADELRANLENTASNVSIIGKKASKSNQSSAISIHNASHENLTIYRFDLKGYQHFAVKPMINSINSNASTKFTVVFQPDIKYSEFSLETKPPYSIITQIIFTVVSEISREVKSLIVAGLIDGLEATVTPNHFDLRKIYLGEEHCEHIKAVNNDEQVDEAIHFMEYSSAHIASITVEPPQGLWLKPGESANFRMTIYALLPGKFNIRLKFKVKDGQEYFVVIRGTAAIPQVRHFPDILEFGTVPVCVPQKRYLLIMNPLSVPMTLQCRALEDGCETPLIFNIFNVDGLLPLTVKNPIKLIETIDDEYDSSDSPPVIFTDRQVDKESSYHSVSDTETISISTKFEEEVLVHIEDFAYKTLWDIRNRRFLEKAEAEKKIMQVTLEHLKTCAYFDDMNLNNYKFMDWNALPSDPQEIYVDKEIVHLNPNTGKKLTVVVIPNNVGYYSRAIEVRCCPIKLHTEDENVERTYIETELMTTKIWFEYNCRVPELQWEEIIDFHNRTIYAGTEYEFIMTFINLSSVGGFVYFDVVPDCDAGEMFFTENQWKFYCEPEFDTYAECAVIYKKWDEITLSGIIRVVGLQKRYPFHISALVLPQKVSVTPKSIYHRFQVLQKIRFYLWIENATPTSTWFSLSFKHEPLDIYFDTNGSLLSPYGQGVFITAIVRFLDPDNYKNVIYVDMHFGKRIEIPIHLLVEGMPLIFTPNIKEGVDAGVILSNTEQNFHEEKPKYFKEIKVTNYGRRTYRLTLNKLKSSEFSCSVPKTKVKVTFTPKFLVLEGGKTADFQITIDAFEESDVYNEFRIHIVEETNKQRFLNFSFVIRAKFVLPEVYWTKREITFSYQRTHKFKEHPKMVIAELNNAIGCDIENVQLKALGPIRIKFLHEDKLEKEISTSFTALEKKDVIVVLNKGALKDKCCTKIEGRILCAANGRIMRSFVLRINIQMPRVKIAKPEMIIFHKERESFAVVEIANIGCLDAQFKWKKQEEKRHFIGEVDDIFAFASEVLSDLFRMLDLSDDSESEDEEENLTLRYQKYRCKLLKAKHYDTIGIREIIMEIIDNLDLEQKRYKMNLGDSDSMNCWESIEQRKIEQEQQDLVDNDPETFDECADKTIQHIIANLNIEDSYDISEASSEECDKDRTIYFYEKDGSLKENQILLCPFHLPKVKKGYALQAVFELAVVGGCSQMLTIILVHLEKTVDILHNNIYLGMKPWYEQYTTDFKILNVTQFPISIQLEIKPREDKKKRHHLSDGYVEIRGGKSFGMTPITKRTIKLTGILGFTEEFIREINVIINEGEKLSVRLRGQGIMPIFSLISKNLKRVEQDQIEIAQEYALLQRIYQFDVFKSITEYDDDLLGGLEEVHAESIAESSTITMISASSDSTGRTERKFFKLLKTYVMVNNNAELPNAIVLDQLLETEKFLERLSYNEDERVVLQMVYNAHLKEKASYDSKLPLNLKSFTIQPLPFELHGYVLHMGDLRMNRFYRFEIELHFFGPGKLTAAARTEIKVPGLSVNFDIKDALDRRSDEYIFYNDCSEANLCLKPYRNMYERVLDQEKDPLLKHAHSYDVDKNYCHKRKRTLEERACIKKYYNSLNKSVYDEHKHHFVHCKVYSKIQKNYSGTILRVRILFKPLSNFYEDGQLLEENLYIDLHMGPTLPILLRGVINKKF